MKKKGNSKEGSWYLHFGPVASSLITSVDCRVGETYVPYDFDVHGRVALSAVGVECVSEIATAELQEILRPKHSHEIVHASIVCTSPTSPVEICVRGAGNTCIINVETKDLVARHGNDNPYPYELIHKWIEKYEPDIKNCWARALDKYYDFYPDEKPV
ncbi:hypothetical protein [Pseudomonas putida]|uniref:hypothetical protein n=1 Tax=Pseudomonas putida TaxID=303 RepID=UPI00130D5F97|nr:hypothetical protein [Pseudomonas putida]